MQESKQNRVFEGRRRERCEQLSDSLINALYLYDYKIVVALNYRDGGKEIPFGHVKGSDIIAKSETDLKPFPVGEGVGVMLSLGE